MAILLSTCQSALPNRGLLSTNPTVLKVCDTLMTRKQLSSQGLYFPASLAAWGGHVTSSRQRNVSRNEACHFEGWNSLSSRHTSSMKKVCSFFNLDAIDSKAQGIGSHKTEGPGPSKWNTLDNYGRNKQLQGISDFVVRNSCCFFKKHWFTGKQ